ncbi:PhzF family phenazine biosynthesis protein [Pseudoalteromonas obscura]|uniref:PhzF family phenazine biosynthesis protein n=1 Tax=Pseudoalteromonas obscura TaxID=3048491 RepID=A0ABT7EJ69_9GAMM|nr:PhzF family phenazine biosynthesis protein [Pseudoalteromonas sp. P94(2023)]MDK2595105.1 PhzF family phenazine biosynthesis protein [Pseudoalteromonas sp. P94(2023)]
MLKTHFEDIQKNEVFVRQVFCSGRYRGGAAHVKLCANLAEFTDGGYLQSVAIRNGVAATAFIFVQSDGPHLIRWFSPHGEIQFCGHGTLAAADVLITFLNSSQETLNFQSASHSICVKRTALSKYIMFLPQPELRISSLTHDMRNIFEQEVRNLKQTKPENGYFVAQLPNKDSLLKFDFAVDKYCQTTRRALVVTALDDNHSHTLYFRYFAPQYGVKEDSATGSAAPLLAVYWQLPSHQVFDCFQLSSRGAFYQISRESNQVCVFACVQTPS